MLANLGAATECEVHEVDPICMNNRKGFGTGLRTCANIFRVMTELEDVANLSKRRPLKIESIPSLHSAVCQNSVGPSRQRRTYFDDMERVERMVLVYAFPAKKLNGKAIDATVLAILLAEFAPAVSGDSSGFKSDEFFKECVAFCPPNQ